MGLKRLNDELFQKIAGLPVCLVEYSKAYLDELCNRYDILPNIEWAVVPDYQKPGTQKAYKDHIVNMIGMSDISGLPENVIYLIISDYYEEAYEKIKDTCRKDIYFFANKETEYDLFYRAKYKDEPLKDLIVFRSGPHVSAYVKGMDFSDNARALFEYMLREGYLDRYEIVWLVMNPAEYAGRYKDESRIRFLPFAGSVSEDQAVRDEYYEALCLAKYIFCTDAYGFARHARPDQIRVQLWHGCGIKTRVNFVPCEKRYEYMTVISKMYAKLHEDSFGLRHDQVLVTGIAKEDWLFHPLKDWKERFHIPDAARYIFWLPTFRMTAVAGLEMVNGKMSNQDTGLPVVDTQEKVNRLNQVLKERNVVMILKLHPFQSRAAIEIAKLSNLILLENEDLLREDVQLNQLLGHADALVSDYSSAAVDYALLDRPIAFTLDDKEEYQKGRAFHWENMRDYLPGMEIFTLEDLEYFVEEVAGGKDPALEKRQEITAKMHDFHDDRSCRRIVEAVGV